MPPAASTRWCPTPEQLMILEEMYRSGVRTPNASQIQQITAHLSYYGKIEGKNVFYWFQNHKARDRQRLRRKLSRQYHQQQFYPQPLHWESPAQMFYQQTPPHCFHHQAFFPEPIQGLNLLHKLETGGGEDEAEWMKVIDVSNSSCCSRPLKTLDLFPTKSTGLKDQCSSSNKSLSCTSFTN